MPQRQNDVAVVRALHPVGRQWRPQRIATDALQPRAILPRHQDPGVQIVAVVLRVTGPSRWRPDLPLTLPSELRHARADIGVLAAQPADDAVVQEGDPTR